MRQNINTIKNLRTIKALRGQALTIDLGSTFTGTISSWMKRDANDANYRSFTIVDNRYLFLPKEKTQDYSSTDVVEGKWFFDVRVLPEGETDPNKEEIFFTGTISFTNNITDSSGSEVTTTPQSSSSMIGLDNTSSTYGSEGQLVSAKDLIISVPTLKTVKALRGESLSIDLGKTFDGLLEAWMKKSPTDTTYRSFTIVDNRYLFLPKEKTQDYYDIETGDLIEKVQGKWYFDVRSIPTLSTKADDEKTIYEGTIEFKNQVTDSQGQELVYSEREYANEFIKLVDTPLSYSGEEGKVPMVNSTETAIEFATIIQDKHYTHDQGMPSQVWTINHGLNKYPTAAAVDTAQTVVMGQIDYVDLNNITITFNASFSGEAYLN